MLNTGIIINNLCVSIMATSSSATDGSTATSTGTEQEKEESPLHEEDKPEEDKGQSEEEATGSSSALTAAKNHLVLEKQIGFLSGATHKDHPILSFSSNGIRVLEGGEEGVWEELIITMNYFSSLIDNSEGKEKGVIIVIDCRRSSQAVAIKALIEKIAAKDFPLSCHSLYLLKTVNQFQQITSLFSKNKPPKLATSDIKEKLKVVSVKDKEELFSHVPAVVLTEDFGGTFPYDHQHWIKNNLLFEKVKVLRGRILEKFPDVRDGLNDFEIPQSVKDAERLMTEHLKLKEYFVNIFAEVDVCMDQLTTHLLAYSEETTHSNALPVAMLPATSVLAYLNTTNEEVHEEQAEFDKFWSSHKSRLDHMMRTCHFKRTIEKVGHLIQGHIEDLTHTELVIGDSLEVALELGEKHEVFVSTCKEKMDTHMKDIQEEHVQLSNVPLANDDKTQVLIKEISDIKSPVQHLTELYQELMKICQQKRDLFIVAVKFHMAARQCEQWCSTVKEFTEILPSDDISLDKAGGLVEQTDFIMKQMTQQQLNTLKEFASCLPEKEVKKLTNKTINKCSSSREKLEKYKTRLLQLVALSYTPPTPPQPPPSKESNGAIKTGEEKDSSIDGAPSMSSTDNNPALSWVPEYTDDESDPATLRKREFIYKEIIKTEKDYIEDLKIILDSYYHEMTPDDRVPLRLRGKRDVIFGNLEEIFRFHNEVFLSQLELYESQPERIGSCFIKHSSDFQLYSSYCQNRPNSEALLTESPECQSFFKEIQIRLAHQLPLNSYLIKPIQRITKYQLLIKDMVKQSTKAAQALHDLQTSLNIMLQVLKNLNDSLHVVGLKGFPGALAEQGRLLVHDPFQVWETTGHSRNLLSRSHERHVFLFEKVVIFSKKKEETTQQKSKEKKSDSYIYKNHLQLADVQLKDHMDDSPLCFSLSLHGQNKMFKLQACSKDVCEMWTKELRRLLNDQFGLLKDVVLKSGTLNRDTAAKYSKMSKKSQGKSQLFDDVPPPSERFLEQKKSFSNRFKINILQKKKSSNATSPSTVTSPQEILTRPNDDSPSVSRSLIHEKGRLYKDDLAITGSVPATMLPITRAYSEDDLLSDERTRRRGEWSDDEDDVPMANNVEHYEILAPGMSRYYTAVADYTPSEDDQGIPLSIDQEVELIGINNSGWWWVRATNYFTQETLEGWVPASYLQISKEF